MILDIAIWSIIILAMVFGFRKGFVYTFIHTIDWILALAAAFIWTPQLKSYLAENTDFYTWLSENIHTKFSETLENADISYNSLPEMIADPLVSASEDLSVSLADSITGFLFSVICL